MTRVDLKHCGKIPEAREELNRSVIDSDRSSGACSDSNNTEVVQ